MGVYMLRLIISTMLLACLGHEAHALVPKENQRSLASIREEFREDHARELMGKYYSKSAVSRFGNDLSLKEKVHSIVGNKLSKKNQKIKEIVARTILEEATKHELDPMFVSAVIEGESSFNPNAKGPVGEIGLMQIRPSTGKWIAKREGIKWTGKNMLKDPAMNIKLGTAYLAFLRQQFDGHGQLYVAAYNMGSTNVKRALKKSVWPKDYPRHVMKRYLAYYKESKPKDI